MLAGLTKSALSDDYGNTALEIARGGWGESSEIVQMLLLRGITI